MSSSLRSKLERKDGGDFEWKTATCQGLCFLFFLGEGLIYNVVVLRLLLPAAGHLSLVVPLAAVFNCIWLLAWWSYIQACLVSPGVVPERWKEFVKESGIIVVASRRMWQPGMATVCSYCNVPRPERAHHCTQCGFCILRFDHHCPWINNCVGFQNHKYFILVGVYAWALAALWCCTSLLELWQMAMRVFHWDWDPSSEVLGRGTPVLFVCAWAFALQALVLITQMLCYYLPIAGRGLTRVEDLIIQDSASPANPYDRISIVRNLAQTFGAPGLDWLIPVPPLRPECDGVSFPRQGDPIPPEEVAALQTAAPDLLEACFSLWCCWWPRLVGQPAFSPSKARSDERLLLRTTPQEETPESRWLRRYRVRPPTARDSSSAKKEAGGAQTSLLSSFFMCTGEVKQEDPDDWGCTT